MPLLYALLASTMLAAPAAPTPPEKAKASEPAYSKALLERAESIERALISPCCYKGTLADHPSPVADQMRREIKQMLAQGRTRSQILAFYKKKYGQAVLTEPPRSGFSSLMLYGIPFGGGALLLAFMVVLLVRRSHQTDDDGDESLPQDHELPAGMQDRIADLVSRS